MHFCGQFTNGNLLVHTQFQHLRNSGKERKLGQFFLKALPFQNNRTTHELLHHASPINKEATKDLVKKLLLSLYVY